MGNSKEKTQLSLTKARINAGLNQKEVAKFMEVSARKVADWEEGRKEPGVSQAKKLSRLYNLSVDDIFWPAVSKRI